MWYVYVYAEKSLPHASYFVPLTGTFNSPLRAWLTYYRSVYNRIHIHSVSCVVCVVRCSVWRLHQQLRILYMTKDLCSQLSRATQRHFGTLGTLECLGAIECDYIRSWMKHERTNDNDEYDKDWRDSRGLQKSAVIELRKPIKTSRARAYSTSFPFGCSSAAVGRLKRTDNVLCCAGEYDVECWLWFGV